MSVRDRIANLNNSKAPLIVPAGSSEHGDSGVNRIDSNSNGNSADVSASNSSENAATTGTAKPSTIAERIARLKLNEVVKENTDASSPAGETPTKSIGSISSKISLLGANIRLGERPPGAMFSNPSSQHSSNSGSRVSTSNSCTNDEETVSKKNHSGESTNLVHVSELSHSVSCR